MTPYHLTEEALAFLPKLARATLDAAVRGLPRPEHEEIAAVLGFSLPNSLQEPRGVFVTLTRNGRLRGCIGVIEAGAPLSIAVRDNALAAAFRDPRFDPLTADELADTRIEISVLTPMRPVRNTDDIVIPRHGVLLSKAGRRAVFLPQVAEEQGWDLDTTLTHLALKAGLAADDWREGAAFSVFEAEVVQESP